MRIRVIYSSQLRDAAGCPEEIVDHAEPISLDVLVSEITSKHGEPFRSLLVNQQGEIHPWILVDRNGALVNDSTVLLSGDDVVRLSSPISGG